MTAIEIIEEKNFLVSVDDRSILKCWDLSESGGTCFQTYKFFYFVEVRNLIQLNPETFVTVSNRLHLFKLEIINQNKRSVGEEKQKSIKFVQEKKKTLVPCDVIDYAFVANINKLAVVT